MKIRRLLVIGFFLLALFLASIRSGALVYALLYTSVLLPVLSIGYAFLVGENMKLHQNVESRNIVKNQPVPYVCRVSNETHLLTFTRIELKFHSGFSEMGDMQAREIITLSAGATDEIRANVVCRRRGRYNIGVSKILVSDILGIVRPSFSPPVEYPVTVYPRIVHLDSLNIFTFEGIRAASTVGSNETTAGDTMHEYAIGDDPRLIHWKASARTGTLQVRQISGVERPGMAIVVDTRKSGEGELAIVREDNLLEALLAMCDYCLVRGIDVNVYAGENAFFIRDNNDFNELYEWTCDMEFSRIALPAQVPVTGFSCCAVLSLGPAEEAMAGLIDAADAGAQCVMMQFGSEPAAVEAPRLRCIYVPDDCDVAQILTR